ncbi:hypothetical protein V8G54_023081 [Vigna mungo]|uniref:Uncharacterized protein n=1 Tax=Vigna mungo TaxID=3915 RepID=A0AAQ3N4D8_VIGMU
MNRMKEVEVARNWTQEKRENCMTKESQPTLSATLLLSAKFVVEFFVLRPSVITRALVLLMSSLFHAWAPPLSVIPSAAPTVERHFSAERCQLVKVCLWAILVPFPHSMRAESKTAVSVITVMKDEGVLMYRQFAVVEMSLSRTAKTTKNRGKQLWDCPKYKENLMELIILWLFLMTFLNRMEVKMLDATTSDDALMMMDFTKVIAMTSWKQRMRDW